MGRIHDAIDRHLDRERAKQKGVGLEVEVIEDPSRDPKVLGQADVEAFMAASGEGAAQARPKRPGDLNPRRAADFLEWVGQRNSRRLVRIGKDLDWLRQQADEYGISREEIRWLI